MGDYYSATAQVIPLLLLALMYEARLLAMPGSIPWRGPRLVARSSVLLSVAAAVVGEVCSLVALSSEGNDRPGFHRVVTLCLTVLFASLVGSMLEMGMRRPPADRPPAASNDD